MELNSVALGITAYGAGLISGFLLRMAIGKNSDKPFDGNIMVLVVVTTIWAISMVVDILSPTYETSPLVHGLMGAIVGFFYRPK